MVNITLNWISNKKKPPNKKITERENKKHIHEVGIKAILLQTMSE